MSDAVGGKTALRCPRCGPMRGRSGSSPVHALRRAIHGLWRRREPAGDRTVDTQLQGETLLHGSSRMMTPGECATCFHERIDNPRHPEKRVAALCGGPGRWNRPRADVRQIQMDRRPPTRG